MHIGDGDGVTSTMASVRGEGGGLEEEEEEDGEGEREMGGRPRTNGAANERGSVTKDRGGRRKIDESGMLA